MSEIRLFNGRTLSCEGVYANPVTYLGITRDALTFVFDPEKTGLEELLEQFTPENCAAVTITDNDETYIHEHYTVRVGAGVGCKDLALRGGMAGNVQDTQPLAWVTMAQSTPAERQMQAQQVAIDALLVAALEEV